MTRSYLCFMLNLSTLLCFVLITTLPHAHAKSCCTLTEEQLQNMRGRSDSCFTSNSLSLLSKCMECEPNTCRLGFRCYCPGEFLSSSRKQSLCEESFLSVWPLSIGKEDRHWRSCAENFQPPEPSTTSCCEMTEAQLDAMVGTSDDCPSSNLLALLSAKCLPCPPGSCRLNSRCYCPSRFLSSSSFQRRCSESFGEPWPNSIGKEDKNWRSCKENSSQSVSADSSNANEGNTAKESTSGEGELDNNQGSSADGTSSGGSASSTVTATSTGSNTETNINVDGSTSQDSEPEANSLTTLEIVGIVAGVVSAVVTVIGSLAALKKRKRNRESHNDEKAQNFDAI